MYLPASQLKQLVLAHCKRLQLLQLSPVAPLDTLSLFGCRHIGLPALNAVVHNCGTHLRSLDLNGALGTEQMTESELRSSCPNLVHLDVSGRARKY